MDRPQWHFFTIDDLINVAQRARYSRRGRLILAIGAAGMAAAVLLAQGAFGPNQAARYAAAAAAAPSIAGQRIEILTSSFDPYRHNNELFHRYLLQRKQASSLRVSPGPHDQRWLSESGVIEMLLSADDVFAPSRSEAP